MRAALLGVDVVNKAVYCFLIALVVLHSNFNECIVLFAVEVNRLRVDGFLFAVEMLNEGTDTAVIVVGFLQKLLRALVPENNRDSLVQECQLSQAVTENLVFVDSIGENLVVRQEAYLRSRSLGLSYNGKWLRCVSALKLNFMNLSGAAYLYLHVLGKGVNNRDTDAVKTAGYLVAVAAEFTACVKHSKNDLDSGFSAFVHVYRDTAPVIYDRDAVVLMDCYLYL